MIIYTYDEAKNRRVKVGVTKGNIFIKRVKRDKHYFWKYKGYGIQTESFDLLCKTGILKIKIIEDKHNIYHITISKFKQLCETYIGKSGKQYIIAEKYLTKEKI